MNAPPTIIAAAAIEYAATLGLKGCFTGGWRGSTGTRCAVRSLGMGDSIRGTSSGLTSSEYLGIRGLERALGCGIWRRRCRCD